MIRHRKDLPAPAEPAGDNGDTADGAVLGEIPDGRLTIRTHERHAAVHTLHATGMSISGIGRELNLDRRTVRRFVRATDTDELLTTQLRWQDPRCSVDTRPTCEDASPRDAPMLLA